MRRPGSRALVPFVVLFFSVGCSDFPTQPAMTANPDTGPDAPTTCASDQDCDDAKFCTGVETCAPALPGADVHGCLPGEPPAVDDGIECTQDRCDDARATVVHDPAACQCQTPGAACDCRANPAACPDSLPLCSTVLCTDALTCAVGPDPGASCDDGAECTTGDACQPDGSCAGVPRDDACDDALYCNGAETCDPAAPSADARGCLAGTAPVVDDGLDCTTDVCDEQQGRVVHTGVDCQPCQVAGDCVPDRVVPCVEVVCAAGVCGTGPLVDGQECDDGFSCTANDVCDADGVCRGARRDAACDDGRWCDGAERCLPPDPGHDPAGCVASPPPTGSDGVACTTDTCVECQGDACQPGQEGTFTHTPTDACQCRSAPDCPAAPCRVAVCDPVNFTCGLRLSDPGTACSLNDLCIQGATCTAQGVCEGGVDDCECRDDAQCPDVSPCEPGKCRGGVCGASLSDVGASCVHPDPCVTSSVCDGDRICRGVRTCECESDGDCRTGACILGARCVDNACMFDYAAPGVPCGEAHGCVAAQCDGGGACMSVADDQLCTDECRRGVCDPDNDGAELDGCVVAEVAPIGTSCAPECPAANAGQCWSGACRAQPEGPTGTTGCSDRVDNDCDGLIDDDDASCRLATNISLTGPQTLPVGLGVATIALVVQPTDADQMPIPYQQANAYCVARHVEWGTDFTTGTIDGDSAVTPTDGAVVGQDIVDGVVQRSVTGVRLCNGHGLDLGPFDFPSGNQPAYALHVEVEVGLDADAPLRDTEHLAIAYRTDDVPNDKFLPLAAVTQDPYAPAAGRYQYVIDQPDGGGSLTLRLMTLVESSGRCARVEKVRIYSLPRIARDREEPQWRAHLAWQYDGMIEAAYQGFREGFAIERFVQVWSGASTVQVDVDGAMIGTHSLEWKYSQADFGLLALPVLVAHPLGYDRADYLMYDFGAGMDDATYLDDRELWHQIVLDADGSRVHRLASVLPDDIPWVEHHLDLGSPANERRRYMIPLPERMKVLGAGRLAMLALFDGTRDSDALLDEAHVYWFTRPGVEDMTVQVIGALTYDGSQLPVIVHSARPGIGLVRCYWQVPDAPLGPTVESTQFRVRFQ